MAKKKKRNVLPRVTVYCMSRRDLIAFVEAVQKLGVLCDDMHAAANKLKIRKPTPPAPPTSPPTGGQP